NKDVRELKGIKICCIGPATAAQVTKRGIKVDLVPEDYISEGILKSLAAQNLQEQKILIPRAAQARDVLPEGLGEMGAVVDVVTAYETVNSGKKKEELLELLNDERIDIITFTSSSTVTNFLEIMGKDFALPSRVQIACIGPVTEATARKAGFSVDIQQEKYTMEGLVQSLVLHFKSDQK
ncbi:MAG: uroporphyrinogen-III synthase, partial [Syntrophaceae bacterium]|nr:uroporphyrinogen-III synthase [Syntrophaceae bacterium]